MDANEKMFSLQEVLNITSKMLASNVTAQDLISQIQEKELTELEDITSFLKSTATEERKNLLDAEFGKGRKKASRKTERLLQEFFPTIDFDGLEQEDIFQRIIDSQKLKKVSSKDISYEQAINVPEIAQTIQKLKAQASETEQIRQQFDTYKKTASFLEYALPQLEQMGAVFSDNPQRRQRQIELLKQEAKNLNFKQSDSGDLIFLDEEGNILMNKQEARAWDSKEYLKHISPVDFRDINSKPDKQTYTPNKKGNNSPTFGFSPEQMKNFTYEDYKQAKQVDPAAADFVLRTMEQNHINNNQ